MFNRYHGTVTTPEGEGSIVSIQSNSSPWVRVEIPGKGEYDYSPEEITVQPVAHVAIEVHICAQRRSYVVRFFGDDADKNAMAYLADKGSTHAWHPVYEEPVDFDRFPALNEFLYPTCEHGLSLALCAGPQHYPYDDEERQHYGF